MLHFWLNNQLIRTHQPHGMVVLDFIRYQQHLKGTKIGCREGDCGACTVLVGELKDGQLRYRSMTSCLMPIANAHGKHIVSVEGLNLQDLNPAQRAIVETGGTQCGFCTVGFVVSLCGFALEEKNPTAESAISAMDGNICRCTGYKSIERAGAKLASELRQCDSGNRLEWLTQNGFVPDYFAQMPERLQKLQAELAALPADPHVTPQPVGGGTDLFVQRADQLRGHPIKPLFDHPDRNHVRFAEGRCIIGAAVTPSDLLESKELQRMFPRLRPHLKLVSSTPIRNMGTVAGNFVNASPIGDLTAWFLALNSTLVIGTGPEKPARELPLRELYLGYKKLALQPGEEIEAVFFPVPEEGTFHPAAIAGEAVQNGTYFNFEKVSKRTYLDIASVNSAARLKVADSLISEAHVSAGGVAPTPFYLARTSAYLNGKDCTWETATAAAEIAMSEVSPISDARGTDTYKRLLLRQLIFAHFRELFSLPEEALLPALQRM